MAARGKVDAAIQNYFLPTPNVSPFKSDPSPHKSDTPRGDGFTAEEVQQALAPEPAQPWCPRGEYLECDIRDLHPGPRAVTFMGRVANIFDVVNSPKTPKSAKGCVKLCVKDDTGAITVRSNLSTDDLLLIVLQVRLWYASRVPTLKLGCLVSVWATHSMRVPPNTFQVVADHRTVSNGEHGALASASAPLFASLFPERDRSCHLMVHENSDDGKMYTKPLGHRTGHPLNGLMTLQNFVDGGCDVIDAKVLLVVKSFGVRKRGRTFRTLS